MERTRQNQAQQAEPEDVADVADIVAQPVGGPALRELLEELRGPAVVKSDVDAFLAALARPPEGDETPRQRADLLLVVIEDAQVRDYTGQEGLTVRAAAVQALVGLGYPYALEVPPDALKDMPGASSGEEGEYRVPGGAIAIAVLNMVLQAVPVVFVLFLVQNWNHGSDPQLSLAAAGGVAIVAPPLLAMLGGAWQLRWLQLTGVVLMVLGCLVLGMACLAALSSGALGLLMLIPAGLQVLATWQLAQPWTRAGD